ALNAPLTMGGLQVGLLLAGVVVIESVFAWPGVGLYTVQSIASTDFPAVAGVTLLLGALYFVINALVDRDQFVAVSQLRADGPSCAWCRAHGCGSSWPNGTRRVPRPTRSPTGRGPCHEAVAHRRRQAAAVGGGDGRPGPQGQRGEAQR